jgi:hypothetical protein
MADDALVPSPLNEFGNEHDYLPVWSRCCEVSKPREEPFEELPVRRADQDQLRRLRAEMIPHGLLYAFPPRRLEILAVEFFGEHLDKRTSSEIVVGLQAHPCRVRA